MKYKVTESQLKYDLSEHSPEIVSGLNQDRKVVLTRNENGIKILSVDVEVIYNPSPKCV